MKKRKHIRAAANEKVITWLPVDSRLFMPFIGFGRVKGISKVFLEVELALSIFVVTGTVLLMIFRIFY
jgi:hypothetical protein